MTEPPVDINKWIKRETRELETRMSETLSTHIPLNTETLHELINSAISTRLDHAINTVSKKIAAESNQFVIKREVDQAYQSALDKDALWIDIVSALRTEVGDTPGLEALPVTHQ